MPKDLTVAVDIAVIKATLAQIQETLDRIVPPSPEQPTQGDRRQGK